MSKIEITERIKQKINDCKNNKLELYILLKTTIDERLFCNYNDLQLIIDAGAKIDKTMMIAYINLYTYNCHYLEINNLFNVDEYNTSRFFYLNLVEFLLKNYNYRYKNDELIKFILKDSEYIKFLNAIGDEYDNLIKIFVEKYDKDNINYPDELFQHIIERW